MNNAPSRFFVCFIRFVCRAAKPGGGKLIHQAVLQAMNLYRMPRPLANEFAPTGSVPASNVRGQQAGWGHHHD